ncbi:uncharacterized protein [Physcomitrium patens]|uniref:uncharacterized protein isoform X3 n=1 Tax=Physcomitrium patens TaxID=3218 RepID=UPI003CCD1285
MHRASSCYQTSREEGAWLVSPSGDRVAWRRGGVVNLYWRSTTLWGLKRILSPMMATLTGSCVFRLCSW